MFEALRENCSEIYSDYYRLTLPTECGLGQEEGTGKPMAVVVFYDPNAGSSSYTAMDEDDRDKMNKALQKAFRGLCYVEIPEVEEMSFGDDDSSDDSSGNDSDNDNNSGSSSDNSSAADAEG